mmetsp:Transcript_4186/g.16813  ORF Transcript_4186/g.16813 Transcript_4186/m.16813 type:complete len:269 (+) Transcript_4186:556-1362(+)
MMVSSVSLCARYRPSSRCARARSALSFARRPPPAAASATAAEMAADSCSSARRSLRMASCIWKMLSTGMPSVGSRAPLAPGVFSWGAGDGGRRLRLTPTLREATGCPPPVVASAHAACLLGATSCAPSPAPSKPPPCAPSPSPAAAPWAPAPVPALTTAFMLSLMPSTMRCCSSSLKCAANSGKSCDSSLSRCRDSVRRTASPRLAAARRWCTPSGVSHSAPPRPPASSASSASPPPSPPPLSAHARAANRAERSCSKSRSSLACSRP